MKRSGKGLEIGLLVACFSMLASGCVVGVVDLDDLDGFGDQEATTHFSRSVVVAGHHTISVIGLNGEIVVVGEEGTGEVTIRATRRVRSNSIEDAQDHLPLVQVVVGIEAGRIMVETDQPANSGGREYQVDYEITVPADFEASIINANGNVVIENLRGDVRIDLGNGNVDLSELSGNSWLALGNGTVDAELDFPLGGEAVYSIGNGSVHLELPQTASAELDALVGNGTISVTGHSLTNTVSGPKSFQATLGSGEGVIDLFVGNGSIQVSGD